MFPQNPGFLARDLPGRDPLPFPDSSNPTPQFRPAPNFFAMPRPPSRTRLNNLVPPTTRRPAVGTPLPMIQTPTDRFAVPPPPTGDRMAVPPPQIAAAPPMGWAPDGTPLIPAALEFVHPGQDKLDPQFRKALEGVSDDMGRDLTITSGYRGPDHPVEAKKPGGPGMHSTGHAADISMADMDSAARQELVRRLYGAGARRFGTYSGSPNMLHVDTKDQHGTGAPHFMFDRTSAKMGAAPEYFRTVASTLQGQGPRTENVPPGGLSPKPNAAPGEPPAQGLFAGFNGEKFRNSMVDFLKQQAKAQRDAAQLRRSAVRSPQAHFASAQSVPWVRPVGPQ